MPAPAAGGLQIFLHPGEKADTARFFFLRKIRKAFVFHDFQLTQQSLKGFLAQRREIDPGYPLILLVLPALDESALFHAPDHHRHRGGLDHQLAY